MSTEAVRHPSLIVFGSINVDLVASPARLPRPGETVLAPSYDVVSGGKGANQAVAAVRARGSLDSVVKMVGAVGHDGFAEKILQDLETEGILTEQICRTSRPTGCAFISVDQSGENQITVASGANWEVRAEQLTKEDITEGNVLLLQNEIPIKEAARAASFARAGGAKVVVNLAPAPEGDDAEQIRMLLQSTDIVVLNEHEIVVVCVALGLPHLDDCVEDARYLADRFALDVVVTLGAKGSALVRSEGEVYYASPVSIVPVDTTGAGDTLTGVLAVNLLERRELKDALRRANKAAALSCLAHGAREGMPHFEKINEVLPTERASVF